MPVDEVVLGETTTPKLPERLDTMRSKRALKGFCRAEIFHAVGR